MSSTVILDGWNSAAVFSDITDDAGAEDVTADAAWDLSLLAKLSLFYMGLIILSCLRGSALLILPSYLCNMQTLNVQEESKE